ncbi:MULTISPECIES: trehalase family glycosidase [unclassified Paenibacillus]|uniref:MGH1-like glycoside hydrolase domain-containing protein n=1 Tax=unclassified Paenibacillus TaxID=185978 RepID=UPI00278717F2|nr:MULTISPECIES: hypothetical protein [unclassified Paenibacillus]MDQ0898467.1 hypothetical protein [Paenibacillus sp. V4I7]MDQ0915537.1 hypothetical protein [Paenibacillus sp. V4I5]
MPAGSRLDEKLRAGKKALRTLPGALLLGSTGARLWADYLDPVPGFSGRFDFIHKVNIPLLFKITNNLEESFEPCQTEWFPSHLHMAYTGNRLSMVERKFISWNDCAVSCQTWTNRSSEELVLRLETYGDAFLERKGNYLYGLFNIEHYSFDVAGVIAVSDPALLEEVRLKPGESKVIIVSAAFGISGQDDNGLLKERASAYAESVSTIDQVIENQSNEYQEWFEKTPTFTSSDPVLNKTWTYRWFLLRHNLADPQYGHLSYPLFYEGRSHKKSKKPFSKGGWEFSKLINLSVPLHIMDARWYHDPVYGEGPFRNMKNAPGEDGMFSCLTVDTIMHSFANFSCWAAYQLYLVHRNTEMINDILPAMKLNVSAWNRVNGNDQDHLMIEYKHTRTGKEYQPSYWYFHQFPKNPKDKETYTHLKRVDRTVYHYLNTLGVAKLCEVTGDPEAEEFYRQAYNIKQDILDKMWNEDTKFFYDLHYQTDEKAFVKNIVGFYPGWAEILDDRFNGMIEHLFNEQEFHTKCPFPSVSADCPAYSQEGGWMGHFVKGRNGCVWDGPTWPYTNSIALDALAKESKRRNHQFDRQFAYYLREYSFLHFMQRDLNQPGLVEHYNSATGEPLSDEQEYNHSYYIDLIISHVAGLTIEKEGIVLDPLSTGLDYFCLDRVKVAGTEIRITYRKPNVSSDIPNIEEGYCLYVKDKLVFSNQTLCRTELSWKEMNL